MHSMMDSSGQNNFCFRMYYTPTLSSLNPLALNRLAVETNTKHSAQKTMLEKLNACLKSALSKSSIV